MFSGAEADLLTKEHGGVQNTNAVRAQFWRGTPEERREALLPFFWTGIARHGQLFGNQNKGSVVTVTNGRKFSYPGYNEILTGAADPRIDSNDKKPNANVTVFEWLNGRSILRNHVAVFGTWDTFPYIFNIERCHLPIWPVWESKFGRYEIPPPQCVADLLRDTTPMWEDLTYDSFLFHALTDYLKRKQPRLVGQIPAELLGRCGQRHDFHRGRGRHELAGVHRVQRFVAADRPDEYAPERAVERRRRDDGVDVMLERSLGGRCGRRLCERRLCEQRSGENDSGRATS